MPSIRATAAQLRNHRGTGLLAMSVAIFVAVAGCATSRPTPVRKPSGVAATGVSNSPSAPTVPAGAVPAANPKSVAYLHGNAVVEAGSTTRLIVPAGANVTAATEIPGGYVFAADNGYVYFQTRQRTISRIAPGQFTVSADGRRLAVMGDLAVSVFELPDLRRLGSYTFPGAMPGGPSVVAVRGDWVLLFDEDVPNADVPGTSVVWNVATHVAVPFSGAEPFAVGADGDVLRRTASANGPTCYDVTPLANVARRGGFCGDVRRTAGGVDGGALSDDGEWAAIAVSNRQPIVLVRTADLHVGRWRPVTLSASGVPIYWAGADVVIGGDRSYLCSTTGQCRALAIPADATIVPRSGFSD